MGNKEGGWATAFSWYTDHLPVAGKKAEFGRFGDKYTILAADEPDKGSWRAAVIVMDGAVGEYNKVEYDYKVIFQNYAGERAMVQSNLGTRARSQGNRASMSGSGLSP